MSPTSLSLKKDPFQTDQVELALYTHYIATMFWKQNLEMSPWSSPLCRPLESVCALAKFYSLSVFYPGVFRDTPGSKAADGYGRVIVTKANFFLLTKGLAVMTCVWICLTKRHPLSSTRSRTDHCAGPYKKFICDQCGLWHPNVQKSKWVGKVTMKFDIIVGFSSWNRAQFVIHWNSLFFTIFKSASLVKLNAGYSITHHFNMRLVHVMKRKYYVGMDYNHCIFRSGKCGQVNQSVN